MTHYLVGPSRCEALWLYLADSPEEALSAHITAMAADPDNEDWDERAWLNVWTAKQVYPEIDVDYEITYQCDPDTEPEGGWTKHVGKTCVEDLQTLIDAHIRAHFKPWYVTDTVVMEHRPEEPTDEAKP